MTDCWTYPGAKTRAGYGEAKVAGSVVYTHRAAYEVLVGPIPDGLELDHLCRNRACYNPAHLEPVTHAENVRRGYWKQKTHCPAGHPYDEVHTYYRKDRPGHRHCRTCNNEQRQAARLRARRRAA